MGRQKSIAIVGAGIAGITTAYFLAKKDYKIKVFDPEGVAWQCSHANGGQLSVCNAEVWNTYSNILKGIKWLYQSDAPLSFRPDIWSWSKLKWIAGFIGATLTNSYDYNTRKTIEWSLRSRKLYKIVEYFTFIKIKSHGIKLKRLLKDSMTVDGEESLRKKAY